jgi:hypothetical protein
MITISRREALYTAGIFAACTLALVLPRYTLLELLPPLTAVCSGLGALVYLVRALTHPAAASSTETGAGPDRPL